LREKSLANKNMNINTLIGKTLSKVENKDNEEIVFTTDEGKKYLLYHDQDCCESVTVEDICGELDDLVGSPIIQAEENSSNDENPPNVTVSDYQDNSFTWTFYRLATARGQVVIRWYGESNGYYSERVSFSEL